MYGFQVVNLEELKGMETLGVPFFGMNLGVALSVGIPGFRTEVATGLINNLPQGASSMMGATSMQEIKQVKPALPLYTLETLLDIGFLV